MISQLVNWAAYQKSYYMANKERLLKYQKVYRRENKEVITMQRDFYEN